MSPVAKNNLFTNDLIAPCGMNCAVCIAHLRTKNRCPGCHGLDSLKPHHCVQCRIKNCPELRRSKSGFCFDCSIFPCTRLRQLDTRYKTKYGMSMIDNLQAIQKIGITKFLKKETKRWSCSQCGSIVSVHRPECLECGETRCNK